MQEFAIQQQFQWVITPSRKISKIVKNIELEIALSATELELRNA